MLAKTTLLSLFVVLLVVAPTLQLGVLWVNQITGNYDTGTVVVEEVIFDDNTMSVDFIRGLGNNGVNVEDTILKAGSVTIPVNLDVGQVATITGLLNANGGIIADAGDDAGFSFKVEDDTGITTINGELRPNGGINVDNGVFTVEDETGETRVANALLRPDGGINVNDGLFTVDADTGDVFTAGTLYVEEDIFIGTSEPADRYIKRIDSDFDFGGNTIIAAQSSTTVGGDLVLEPGYGTTVGRILLGRAQNDEIRLGRVGIQGTASFGGITRFQGQSSDTGRGGDLFVRAGNGGSGFDGGDLYLAPGASSGNSGSGVIYLGSDDCLSTDLCNSDIEVRRPTSTVSSGGATILSGQDSTTGRGGDYIIRAGNSEFNDGGDLYLVPGAGNEDVTYGTIFIGRDSNDELRIRRPSSPSPAGPLFLQGQDSANGNGGDIHIEAGDAGVSGINGGSIYLSTGNSGTAGVSGTIVLGNIEDELLVLRPDSGNSIAATKTTISGQNSLVSNGGDFVLSSGNGELNGGLLQLLGGEGKLGGGDVLVRSGDGQTDGGDILIEAGFGANGGDVVITSGAGANAGDVVLSGGLGASVPGNVVVRNADAFIVDQADVNIQGGDLYIQRGPCPDGNRPADCTSNNYVRLSSDPSSFLSYFDANAQQFYTLLTRRQINVPLPPSQAQVAGLNPSDVVQRLANTLYSLVNALGQCGHGLIQVRARDGSAAYPGGCTFPGPIPDITGGIAIPAGLPDGEALEH